MEARICREFLESTSRPRFLQTCPKTPRDVAVRRAYRRCVRNVSACSTDRQQQQQHSADLQAVGPPGARARREARVRRGQLRGLAGRSDLGGGAPPAADRPARRGGRADGGATSRSGPAASELLEVGRRGARRSGEGGQAVPACETQPAQPRRRDRRAARGRRPHLPGELRERQADRRRCGATQLLTVTRGQPRHAGFLPPTEQRKARR